MKSLSSFFVVLFSGCSLIGGIQLPIDHPYGVVATHRDLEELSQGLEMPAVMKNGQVAVLNPGGGYAIIHPDPISQQCIEYCKTSSLPLLDLGAGYGTISTRVLLGSSNVVIAEDIGVENLLVLRKQVDAKFYPRLYLNASPFPDFDLPSESLGAVSMCQLAHFMTGEQIDRGLKKIYEWLVPGGKLFIVTCSPYISVLQPFVPIYEERWSKGELWPGFVDNYRSYRKTHQNVPNFIHVMDERPMRAALKRAGFEVETMTFVDRRETIPTLALDGRESVGVIAVKPSKAA